MELYRDLRKFVCSVSTPGSRNASPCAEMQAFPPCWMRLGTKMSERPLGREAALAVGAFIRFNSQYNENKHLSYAIFNVYNDTLNVYTIPRLMSFFAPSGPPAVRPVN